MRTVAEVMTPTVVVVDAFTPFKEIVRRMHEYRVSAVPVVDEDDVLIGIVSEGDLILKEDPALEGTGRLFESSRRRIDRSKAAGLTATDVQSAPVLTVGPDAPIGEAARRMHERHVKRLPVVDAGQHVIGIVSRSDLLKVFLRPDAEIANEISEDVIRRTLWIDPGTIRVLVRDGVVQLQGQIERRSLVPAIERLVLTTEGVIGLDSRLSWQIDDLVTEVPFAWSMSWGR